MIRNFFRIALPSCDLVNRTVHIQRVIRTRTSNIEMRMRMNDRPNVREDFRESIERGNDALTGSTNDELSRFPFAVLPSTTRYRK